MATMKQSRASRTRSDSPPGSRIVSRLVLRQAGVPGAVGQGDDVDLPAQRHVHLHVLPDGLHERAHLDDGAVAESRARCSHSTCSAVSVPLLLIGIMTLVLITSSGTMAMAVNFGYRRDRGRRRR